MDEEDDGGVQLVEETIGEMVMDDTQDVEEIKVEQLGEDLHPHPPQEDPDVTRRMERRKEPTMEPALKKCTGFRKKFRLQGYQLYYRKSLISSTTFVYQWDH